MYVRSGESLSVVSNALSVQRSSPTQPPEKEKEKCTFVLGRVYRLGTYVFNIISRLPVAQPQEHEYRIPPGEPCV